MAARTCGEFTGARLGGDEFAVLLDDIRDPKNANLIADRIQQELAPAFILASRTNGRAFCRGPACGARDPRFDGLGDGWRLSHNGCHQP